MHGARREIPNASPYNKYGDSARIVEIGAVGKRGGFCAKSFFGDTGRRGLNRRKIDYALEINQIRPTIPKKQGLTVAGTGN